jgi:5'-nucleotidase
MGHDAPSRAIDHPGGRRIGSRVQILLTNDDGIYAPGLAALERELRRIGDVVVVAPATEQSGVGHSITVSSPMICKEVSENHRRRGWAVEGSPADCVKLGIFKLCRERPNLVVSGMNGGLNAGINVFYSGTVAAAIEGALFGITGIAVSLEFDEHPQFDKAARIAGQVIRQILENKEGESQLYNLNIPTAAVDNPRGVRVVPLGVAHYREHFIERTDPRGRTYYWASNDRPTAPSEVETDITALGKGLITLTPLQYDMTKTSVLERMERWQFKLGE